MPTIQIINSTLSPQGRLLEAGMKLEAKDISSQFWVVFVEGEKFLLDKTNTSIVSDDNLEPTPMNFFKPKPEIGIDVAFGFNNPNVEINEFEVE